MDKRALKTEGLAGLTTFMAMAYILVVNPLILSKSGIPIGKVVVGTAIVAGLSTILTGLYAKKPFAMAPYMGENVLFTYAIVLGMGIGWKEALGAVFWGGFLFMTITLLGLRPIMARAVPTFLSTAWSVGIGLFLVFVGFSSAGISMPGVPGAPVHVGNMLSRQTLAALAGIALTLGMLLKKFKPGILLGILFTMLLAWALGTPLTMGGNVKDSMLNSPFVLPALKKAIMDPKVIPLIVLLFMVDMFDTMGTVLGLSHKAGFLDEKGKPKDVERVFHIDALASMVAPFFAVSTTGTYIESATGIEAGGRTGLSSIITGMLFLISLPLAGFIAKINPEILQLASAPALVAVGFLMISLLGKIDVHDPVQVITLGLAVSFMLFTYNIALGIAASLVAYPLASYTIGKKKIHPVAVLLSVIGLLLFVLYPY